MWSQLALCLFVGLAFASSNPGWKDNTDYVYLVRGRTLASLHEVSNQYSGILLKAKLRIQPKSDGKLQGQVFDAYYSQVHTHLHQWDTYIPDAELSWKTLKMSSEPFQVEMKGGVITDLIVNKDLSNWEANLIRSILSQFQLNTNEAYLGKSSSHPNSGGFTTMEDTITGNVETFYKINPLPVYLVRNEPWYQKALKSIGEGEIIEITKHKNYTNSFELPAYSHGFGYTYEGLPGTNFLGNYFIRDATSRVIVSGTLKKYTIQHSFTANRIMANPTLRDKQKGSVHSLMNVTLEEMKEIDKSLASVQQPIRLGNLVYSYSSPFADEDKVHEKSPYQQMNLMRNEMDRKSKMGALSWPKWSTFWPGIFKKQESSGSAEEEDSQETYKKNHPLIRNAPEVPMVPFSVGYLGVTIKKAVNVIKSIESLSREISVELQEPNRNLQETLSKFIILSSLIRTLNEEEVQNAASQLYSNEQEGPKRDAWQVFRDSVADSGTGPALLIIQKWIQSQKLTKSDAAFVFATMMRSVRQPGLEYMQTAFELLKSKQVQSEAPLNTTALLSYTDLVHKVYMNKMYYSKNQYPEKSFKHFNSEKGRKFVKESVVPYCTEQLQEAISKGETSKIHAYILALGNIADPGILRAFQPYLEGKMQASQYQRLLMILSLKRLAIYHPEQTRDVLFRVYQNIGELEEIRAAAVLYLMYTIPKTEMLQYMASYTNVDVHEQVNAIVKNSIEEMSQFKAEQLYELRVAAEAAKPLVTKKVYGVQYGFVKNRKILLKELGLSQAMETLVFGSPETYMPKGFSFSITNDLKGNYDHLLNVFGIVSSVEELVQVLKLQTQEYITKRKEQNGKFAQQKQNQWSSQHIASLLNLDRTEREQLEGVLTAGFEVPYGMVSFDNRTIERLARDFGKYEKELRDGKKLNYIKLVNNGPLALSFPTEMGLPFLFTRESPTLLRVKGKFQVIAQPKVYEEGKIHMPNAIKMTSNTTVTVSGKRQGQLSFITPFDHQQYIAGYDKHWQVFIPVTFEIGVDIKEGQVKVDIEPCQNQSESSLLEYNTQPYTSRIDIIKLQPVSVQPQTHPIEQRNLRVYDEIIGEKQTGLALRVQMKHERQYVTSPKILRLLRTGSVEGLMELWNDAEIQQSQFKISHVVPKSSTRKMILRFGKQQEYYKLGDMPRNVSDKLEDPQVFQKIMMKKASAGINSVTSQVYDASVEFQGEHNIRHRLTGAFAKSDVDPKSRLFVEYKMNSEKPGVSPYLVSFQAHNEVPNTNALDMEFSLQNEPKVDSEMSLVFGENYESGSKVQFSWTIRRSTERKEFLKEQPFYRQCQQDQRDGNKQTPACLNMTIEANFLDRVYAQIKSEKLRPQLKEILKAVYYGVRLESLLSYEFDSEQKSGSHNEVKMDVAFGADLRTANISVQTVEGKTLFNDLVVGELSKELTVLHPVYHLRSRLVGKALGIPTYRRFCVVDRSQITTFNNLTFSSEISKQWTVLVQYIPTEGRYEVKPATLETQLKNQVDNYVILARKSSLNNEKKEMRIALSTPETEFKVVEITMTPASSGLYKGKVTVNGQLVQISDKQSYDLRNGYIQMYALPNGEIKFEVKGAFYTLYDGERIRVVPNDGKLNNANRGICGQYTNNKFEDLVTPLKCYIRDFSKFVKSFEIEGQGGHNVRKELAKNSKKCVSKNVPFYVSIMSSEQEHLPGKCNFFQTRYIEQNNEICFTTRSIPACKAGCQPQGTVTKDVPVHCVRNSRVSQLWKDAIERGENPDFSHKKEDRSVPMQLPQRCVE